MSNYTYSFVNNYHYAGKSPFLSTIDRTLTPIRELLNGKEVFIQTHRQLGATSSLALKVACIATSIIAAPIMLTCLLIKYIASFKEKHFLQLQVPVLMNLEKHFVTLIQEKDFKSLRNNTWTGMVTSGNSLVLLNFLKNNIHSLPDWTATPSIFNRLEEEHAIELIDLYVQDRFLNAVTPSSDIDLSFQVLEVFIKISLEQHEPKARSVAFKRILKHPKFKDPDYTNLMHLKEQTTNCANSLDKATKGAPSELDKKFKQIRRNIPISILMYGVAALVFSFSTRA